MKIKDILRYKNIVDSCYQPIRLDISNFDSSKTVLINFGLSNEEDAIYSYKNFKREDNLYKSKKENFISLKNLANIFKKIYVINNFIHYDINEKSKLKAIDFLIPELQVVDEKAVLMVKNGPNLFMSPAFIKWLSINLNNTDNFIVSGFSLSDDIFPFLISLSDYFKESKLNKKIFLNLNASLTTESLNNNPLGQMDYYMLISYLRSRGVEVVDIRVGGKD